MVFQKRKIFKLNYELFFYSKLNLNQNNEYELDNLFSNIDMIINMLSATAVTDDRR